MASVAIKLKIMMAMKLSSFKINRPTRFVFMFGVFIGFTVFAKNTFTNLPSDAADKQIAANSGRQVASSVRFSNCVSYVVDSVLDGDLRLSARNQISIDADVTLDGDGFTWTFPSASASVVHIKDGCTLTLTNLLLDNVSSSHFKLGQGSRLIFGDGVFLQILKTENIDSSWFFAGSGGILGRGQTINLAESSQLCFLPASTWVLSNLNIDGLKNTNLQCVDDSAHLVLDNVTLFVSHGFAFVKGQITVQHSVLVRGGGVFSYQSAAISRVDCGSSLTFSDGTTLVYNPLLSESLDHGSQQNLWLTDRSSKLIFDGGHLWVASSGMLLLRGCLEFRQVCKVHVDSSVIDYEHGLRFGNGRVEDDLLIESKAGSKLELTGGIIYYDNVDI